MDKQTTPPHKSFGSTKKKHSCDQSHLEGSVEGDPGWPWRQRKQNKDQGCQLSGRNGAKEVGLSCSYHPQLPSMGPSQVLTPEFQEPEITPHRMAGVQLWVISPLELILPRRGHQWSLLPSEGKGYRRGFAIGLPGFPPKNIYNSSASSQIPILSPGKLTLAYLLLITDQGCP